MRFAQEIAADPPGVLHEINVLAELFPECAQRGCRLFICYDVQRRGLLWEHGTTDEHTWFVPDEIAVAGYSVTRYLERIREWTGHVHLQIAMRRGPDRREREGERPAWLPAPEVLVRRFSFDDA